MPAITVRDVPEPVRAELAARARARVAATGARVSREAILSARDADRR